MRCAASIVLNAKPFFFSTDMLNVHMWATHPDVVTACDECGFICESSEVLVVHKLKSHVISEISSELTLDMTASGDNSTAEVLPNTDITVVVENADVTDDSEEQEEEEEDPSETTDVMYACQMCSFVAADISVVSAHLTQVHKVSPEHQPSVAEGDTETILVELDAWMDINSSDARDHIFGITGPMPFRLMPWLLKSPEHRQAWYWLCRTDIECWFRVNFIYLGQAKFKILFKMWIFGIFKTIQQVKS